MTRDELAQLPIGELVPHAPPMLLLDRVVEIGEESLEAEVTIRPASEFCQEGAVGGWIGIEYMAQAVAALAGAEGRLAGKPTRVGLLLATRKYESRAPAFPVGWTLRVRVTKVFCDPQGLSVVECVIRRASTAEELARASLTVFQVDDFLAFLKEHRP